MAVWDTGVESPLCLLGMVSPAGENKHKNGQNQNDMASIALVESAEKKRQLGPKGSTHVAVAANISCLFASVHKLSAAAKSTEKTIIRHIFKALCPVTKYKTADGPTSKATVVRTRTRRTTMSMRRLLYR